jgi:3',5'-cyclic AMP phosphodiesterase CpdA
MYFRLFAPILLLLLFSTNVSAAEKAVGKPFSFVVLGHIRGNDDGLTHLLLDHLLAEVRELKPDMIFLTGDMIWGGIGKKQQEAEVITQDWNRLDAKLARLGIPVYRVPGNHDLHDPITRDIYFARYGMLPRAFTYRGSRFLLLNSSYVPEGSEAPPKIRGHQAYLRGKQLDSEQIDFIRKEFSSAGRSDNFFLFMHHILWWHEEEAVWWREVHPLLIGRKVRAVFAGDVGPRKFSHLKRDGIDYLQSSIADIPMRILRSHWRHRMIAQQFDNYLHVTVDGPRVHIQVHTIGELSSGQFTPENWREMLKPGPVEDQPVLSRVWEVIGSPRRLILIAFVMAICFLGGIGATLLWYRRGAA